MKNQLSDKVVDFTGHGHNYAKPMDLPNLISSEHENGRASWIDYQCVARFDSYMYMMNILG